MKKCPKCGSRIREGSVFCINCGARLSIGKYAKKTARKSPKLLLVMIFLVAIIAMGILIQHNTKKNVSLSTESEVTIIVPDDLSIDPEDVRFENQQMFVDSQLLLKVQTGTSYEEVEELVAKENGVIIGYISFSGDYHIDFPSSKTYAELEAIQQRWKNESFIDTVSFNQIFMSSTSAVDYTNDPWKETWFLGGITDATEKWTEGIPDGNNWWAEAIYMPSVWEMDLWDTVEKGTVNVGVIDSVFAPSHKDLKNVISKTWNNSFDENNVESGALSHGTHVSGIIAAELGNDVGIAGVASCIEPKLFCYAMHGKGTEVYGSTMEYKYAIAMLLEEGVEIINISMGFNDVVVFAAEQGNTMAQEIVTSSDESLAIFLKDALSAGYDFLIVKSAGNTSNNYFVECEVTDENPFGYRAAEPNEAGAMSSRCSAKWNLFAGIHDAAVRDRIIIVGAAKKTIDSSGNVYVAADFSNNDCDVYAPGVDILSLAYGDTDTVSFPGTSQATPIVTGIATLLKATNPNISSVQIKEIILKSVPNLQEQNSVTEDQVSIVNAAVAVYYGRGWSTSERENDRDSAILGTVYENVEIDGEERSYGITNATVSIYSQNQNEPIKVIDTQETGGGFNGYFTAGNYSVSVEAEGYIKHTSSFVLEENDVIYLSIQLHPEEFVEKKLAAIITYQDNKKSEEYHFSYNDLGQVVELIAYRYEGEEAIQWYVENYEYDSNANLILVKHGSPQDRYQYDYDYDVNGRIKGYSFAWYTGEVMSPESDNYILSYDDQGRIIGKRNEYGSDIQEYSYDESSNAVYAIREYGWGDGHFLDKTTYDYTYAPLIIQTGTSESAEYGNSSSKSISFMPHWNLSIASTSIDDSCSFEVDPSGYLMKVKDANGNDVYACLYEESTANEKPKETNTDLLTVERQYELNTFLSYFSQQWFNEVNPKTYEVKTDPFDVQNADLAQLIRFVHLYTKINNDQVLSDSLDQDSKVHLSLDYINNKLQQFFGILILSQDVQNSGYELRDGNIYFDFALGETYNNMTIARSWSERSDGTVSVAFDIYRCEGKYMYAGGPIIVEDVYWYSAEDAQQDADLIYYKSGTATVRPVRNGNKIAYQLLQYELEGQSQSRDDISFSDIPSEFVFSSGAGGWGTYLTIEADGSFKGEYHDSDMGITGEGYPRGTVYICGFHGKFAEPQKVSEYVYSMKLESLNVKESAGTEYIENEIRYIVSEPYGMENADEFYIYLPGASMAELPEAFLSWTHIDRDIRDTLPSGYYGIYNAGGEKGFTATEDDCIWNRDYMYYYQNRKAAMWPRYYGMSHVLFWPESGAAVIDLQFAWKNDNQTEFDAHDANGSGEYHISFDISDDMSTVIVSVTSSNGVDLSSWGGTADGHFTATFVNE